MTDRGVCIVAYGEKAQHESSQCLRTVRREKLNVFIQSASTLLKLTDAQKARYAKITLPEWSPFTDTLYLDADTRIHGDVGAGFEALDSGFDMVITPSSQQGEDLMWHIGEGERSETFNRYGAADILQLQGGVLWFRKNDATQKFFNAWREEWMMYQKEDQAALLRAMKRAPLRVHLLGFPFNGGAVIAHRWGAIRQ